MSLVVGFGQIRIGTLRAFGASSFAETSSRAAADRNAATIIFFVSRREAIISSEIHSLGIQITRRLDLWFR